MKNNVFTIMSLIFGVLACIFEILALLGVPIILTLITAIVSIVLGIVAFCLKSKPSLPIIGITLSGVSIFIALIIMIMAPIIDALKSDMDSSDIFNDTKLNSSNTSKDTFTNKIYGTSWTSKSEETLLNLNSNGTFKYYKDKKDLTDSYYEGTYSVYLGKEAVEYVTDDLKRYGVTSEELKNLFLRRDEYSENNFCCIVLTNNSCIVNGRNTLTNTVVTPYYGFYLESETLSLVNMNTATTVIFEKR